MNEPTSPTTPPSAPAVVVPPVIAPATPLMPPAKIAPVVNRKVLRTVLKILAVMFCLGFLCIGSGIGFIWYKATRPSFGPENITTTDYTVAPHVHVEVLPSSYKLSADKFSDFDITPDGAIIVQKYGQLYDMIGGTTLGPVRNGLDDSVRSLAFVDGGLAVSLESGNSGLAFLQDNKFSPVDLGDAHATAVYANQARDRLYIVDGKLLYSLAPAGKLQPECSSTEEITAVAGDDVSCLFATHGAIFRMIVPGEPVLLLKLPDFEDVLGIASTGETVYFANAGTVYMLKGDVAVPLVIGLGGKLRLRPDGLYLLDHNHGRVFRIVVDPAASTPEK